MEIDDYRRLLAKYVAWVGYSEGVDFIDENMTGFTKEETDELMKISKEVNENWDEWRNKF